MNQKRAGLLLLLMVGTSLVGCSVPMMRASESFSLNAAWDGYEHVSVQTRNGSVKLIADDGPDIRIEGVKSVKGRTLEDAQANLERLSIHAAPSEEDPSAFSVALNVPEDLRHQSPGARFEIRIPEPVAANIHTSNGRITAVNLRGEVELRSSNGQITVRQVDGTVHAYSSNGRITAEDVQGPLTLDSSNGRIVARNIGGDCRLETSNGSIEARQVQGNLYARSSNGGIRADAHPEPEGTVEARTSNGAVRLTLPKTLRGRLTLRASNGPIHAESVDMPMTTLHFSRHKLEADLNFGGEGRIVGITSNGSITLDWQ